MRMQSREVGCSSRNSQGYSNPSILKAYGGFKFRIVCGYPGSMEFPMVLARGEVDLISSSWNAWRLRSDVADGTLRAGEAELPLDRTSEVVPLDEKQAALLRGPRADPAAHLMLRPYLKRAVYIRLADPGSGVPYWLVATRHPAELATAIERGRQSAGRQAVG